MSLRVDIIEAKNLIKADTFGMSDPYVIVTVGEQTWRTSVIKNNLNPVWKEFHVFKLTGATSILLSLKDEDNHKSNDDPLGECLINLDRTLLGQIGCGPIDEWYPVMLKGVASGTIHVKLSKI